MAGRKSVEWMKFLNKVKRLELDGYFFYDRLTSQHRNAISHAKVFLDTDYTACKDGDRYRVTRIE